MRGPRLFASAPGSGDPQASQSWGGGTFDVTFVVATAFPYDGCITFTLRAVGLGMHSVRMDFVSRLSTLLARDFHIPNVEAHIRGRKRLRLAAPPSRSRPLCSATMSEKLFRGVAEGSEA